MGSAALTADISERSTIGSNAFLVVERLTYQKDCKQQHGHNINTQLNLRQSRWAQLLLRLAHLLFSKPPGLANSHTAERNCMATVSIQALPASEDPRGR